MTRQLHFCIHGAGGLGSVIGGFLARGGHKVTLIARKPHVEAIRQGGLQIEGCGRSSCSAPTCSRSRPRPRSRARSTITSC
ncbi:ketopantoate reductase family protein [Novosphingobium panipatense]